MTISANLSGSLDKQHWHHFSHLYNHLQITSQVPLIEHTVEECGGTPTTLCSVSTAYALGDNVETH